MQDLTTMSDEELVEDCVDTAMNVERSTLATDRVRLLKLRDEILRRMKASRTWGPNDPQDERNTGA